MANCLRCGCALNIRPLIEGSREARHNDTLYADCLTPGCDLQGVTLPLDELLSLTAAQIEGWGRMNSARRERQARMYGAVYA